ncbi:tetratricopeptide repeat protein [Cellvibrio sp. KY-GH-1]|uniref:tetratricopeptide repeat protein n=1 Tax=Cellvibrio sp. KY-GH-1 TaxID=2303332 RepID=UPI00178149B2|nr:tetratricopeptide repeat protein [Cellvibrio sp. KY-GH-1]
MRAAALFRHQSLVLALASLACLPGVEAKEKMKTSVADLRYGVALYHYYQQDYIPALSELMVADTRDGIQGHSDNPELIAGGISLAFGMQHHAESVFTTILQDERRPEHVRDAAWFYLGKLHYIRGDQAAAEQSFARVSSNFKPSLRAQLQALQFNIRIRNNNFAEVKPEDLEELRSWNPYALYNLGAAHARAGNFKSAQEFFEELADIDISASPSRQKEEWALQDKAYTALGYSFLAEKKYRAAIREFTKVRLEGPLANQALLGYGWAAVAQEEYAVALKPWQVLRQRSLMQPAVQESLLAIPYAYEKLDAQGEAVKEYHTAEELLAREIQLIREMRATLTQGELLTLVGSEAFSDKEAKKILRGDGTAEGAPTAVITDDGQNWLKLDKTSVIKTRSAYLNELFAKNSFQTSVLDLRDLLRIQTLLQQWQPKLEAYRELLLEKQASRSRHEQQSAQQLLAKKQQTLSVERDQLAARLQTIASAENYIALADEDTRALYQRIERGEKTIQQMQAAGQNTADVESRLNMFKGILLWRAAQAFPERMAEQHAELKTIDDALATVAATRQRIEEVTLTSMDIQPVLARLDVLRKDVNSNLQHTEQLIDQQSASLREQVDAQLATHEKRLNNYLAQAHLAVARLYDAELRKQPE